MKIPLVNWTENHFTYPIMNHQIKINQSILSAKIVSEEPVSEYWKNTLTPVIECPVKSPVFHESGYASGHANEKIEVPGLLNWFKQHHDGCHHSYFDHGTFKRGMGWCRIKFNDITRSVFLHTSYDSAPGTEIFTMSN